MGKNSSGCTVGKTCVVILRNSFFFFTCFTSCSSTKETRGLLFMSSKL